MGLSSSEQIIASVPKSLFFSLRWVVLCAQMGSCCCGFAKKTEEQGASEDTSIPSTYRSPPTPIPYHIALVASENETSKPVESVDLDVEEEDSCPICLEEYEKENPKLITKCDHYFHLACILEWMERSNSCPVCDQELIFDPPLD